jgi:hypothetical protein
MEGGIEMVALSLIGQSGRKTSKGLLKKTNSVTGLGVDKNGNQRVLF